MVSAVIKGRRADDTNQLTLSFEPGLSERFTSLRECVATGIYHRGLSNVAPSLNKAPGNLSVELSEDQSRKFSVDALELYIEKFGDLTPIYYLVERFIQPKESNPLQQAAMAQLPSVMAKMLQVMKDAGVEL